MKALAFLFLIYMRVSPNPKAADAIEPVVDGGCDFVVSHLSILKRTKDSIQFSYKLDKNSIVSSTPVAIEAWLGDNSKDKQVSIYKAAVRMNKDSTYNVAVRAPSANKKALILAFKVLGLPCLDNHHNNEIAISLDCIHVQQQILALEAHIKKLREEMQATQNLQMKGRLNTTIRSETASLNNLRSNCCASM
jgi:hypothetical protein